MSVLPAVKDGDRVWHMQDNSLYIKNVRKDDAGTYSCQATIRGRPIKKSLPISVVVNGKALFILLRKVLYVGHAQLSP